MIYHTKDIAYSNVVKVFKDLKTKDVTFLR